MNTPKYKAFQKLGIDEKSEAVRNISKYEVRGGQRTCKLTQEIEQAYVDKNTSPTLSSSTGQVIFYLFCS